MNLRNDLADSAKRERDREIVDVEYDEDGGEDDGETDRADRLRQTPALFTGTPSEPRDQILPLPLNMAEHFSTWQMPLLGKVVPL